MVSNAQTARADFADVKTCKDIVDRNYKDPNSPAKAGEPNRDAREQARDFDKSRCENKAERNSNGGLKNGCTYSTDRDHCTGKYR